VSEVIDDFVALTGIVVVSPALKLSVNMGRFDLNANGSQTVNVYYDAALSSERLFMPETESSYYIEPSVAREPLMIPAFSKARVDLFGFHFAPPRTEGDLLIYSAPAYDREMAQSIVRAITRTVHGEGREKPFELLYLVTKAVGLLTDWPTDDSGQKGSWEAVDIRIGSEFAAVIEDETRFSLPLVNDRECRIAIQPIIEGEMKASAS